MRISGRTQVDWETHQILWNTEKSFAS